MAYGQLIGQRAPLQLNPSFFQQSLNLIDPAVEILYQKWNHPIVLYNR